MILITNDDGIYANGIKALTEVAREFDQVIVFAPDGPRSGMSNAISCNKPLKFEHVGKLSNVSLYSCTGTPTDCVKLAVQTVFKNAERPLILSGINHGSNASVNIIYSGTMGAVLEANIIGIPAIGFSINNLDENADLESAKDIVRFVLQKYYDGEYDSYYADTFSDVPVCLNVNIPDGDVKGVMLCNQARGKWSEDFELRKNADGEDEYWLVGEFHNLDKDRTDTDLYALENHYVSIVPVTSDMTLRFCPERKKQ